MTRLYEWVQLVWLRNRFSWKRKIGKNSSYHQIGKLNIPSMAIFKIIKISLNNWRNQDEKIHEKNCRNHWKVSLNVAKSIKIISLDISFSFKISFWFQSFEEEKNFYLKAHVMNFIDVWFPHIKLSRRYGPGMGTLTEEEKQFDVI